MQTTPLFCASVFYPYTDGVPFDLEQYTSILAPEFARLLGDNCVRYEVRKGLNSPGSPNPLYLCSAHFYIGSPEQFGAAMGMPEMQQLMGRIATFTAIVPARQFEQVL